MERPTWVTIVGVLGIIFGCFGVLGGGQEMLMPKIMEMQKGMFTHFQEAIKKQHERNTDKSAKETETTEDNHGARTASNAVDEFPIEIFDMMQKMWEVPEWFGTWSIFSGLSKAAVSALMLLASIWLLMLKKAGIKLFYIAAGLSIFLCVAKGIIALSAMSFMMMAMMFGGAFGAFIDVVLIIVVATGSKEVFLVYPKPQQVE